MEPVPLGLDSDADAAAARAREPARAPADPAPVATVAQAIDWTRPPYTVGSIVRLVLDGENPATIPGAVQRARIDERYRQLRGAAASPTRWTVDASNYRERVRGVFFHSAE